MTIKCVEGPAGLGGVTSCYYEPNPQWVARRQSGSSRTVSDWPARPRLPGVDGMMRGEPASPTPVPLQWTRERTESFSQSSLLPSPLVPALDFASSTHIAISAAQRPHGMPREQRVKQSPQTPSGTRSAAPAMSVHSLVSAPMPRDEMNLGSPIAGGVTECFNIIGLGDSDASSRNSSVEASDNASSRATKGTKRKAIDDISRYKPEADALLAPLRDRTQRLRCRRDSADVEKRTKRTPGGHSASAADLREERACMLRQQERVLTSLGWESEHIQSSGNALRSGLVHEGKYIEEGLSAVCGFFASVSMPAFFPPENYDRFFEFAPLFKLAHMTWTRNYEERLQILRELVERPKSPVRLNDIRTRADLVRAIQRDVIPLTHEHGERCLNALCKGWLNNPAADNLFHEV